MKLHYKFFIFFIMVIIFISTITISGCMGTKPSEQLTIYVWEGYLPENVIKMFENETNIKLNVNLATDNATMATLLRGGGRADIIMPTQNQVNRFYVDNLAQPINLNEIPNYKNVSNAFKNKDWSMWDGTKMGSGDLYVIAYVFGTSGIVLNTQKLKKLPENIGWEILFDPELKGRASSRNSAESLMICMDVMGIPRESLLTDTEAALENIRPKAIELRDNVLKFYDTGAEILDLLKNEEIWVSHIWDGGARKLKDSDPKFIYVLPYTGGFGWTDTFMIPASAANPEGAHQFINFMLRPDIAAIITSEEGYTTTIEGALELAGDIKIENYIYSDEDLENLVWQLNFPEEVIDTYNAFWEELSVIR